MNASLRQDRLEIEVHDFGPIVRAKIDLRPMTVLIGPSNTGKSYLAILLYALHRFFGDTGIPGYGSVGLRNSLDLLRSPQELPERTIVAFEQLAQTANFDAVRNGGSFTLPDAMMNLLQAKFSDIGNAISSGILWCFGLGEAKMLVRKGRNDLARVTIRRQRSGDATTLEHTLLLGGRDTKLQTTMPNQLFVSTDTMSRARLLFALLGIHTGSDLDGNEFSPTDYWMLMNPLMDVVVPNMVGDLHWPAFYLPADRTGVVHAHSAIVSSMIDSAPLAGLQPLGRAPMISGVFAAFLRQLIQVDQVPRQPDEASRDVVRYVSRQIEKKILHGTVGVEHSELINYPHFTYRPDGWKEDLPLMHASSMVSDLAPIVLYLRHLARPGNVLIIEEPESHLHPAMQVELTRQLAKLVQAGYRLIITTHSEWILEELANILRRSQLSSDDLGAVSESDAALTEDQVGVWSFEPTRRPKGARVVEAKREPSGLYDTGFDDVAIALHNDWANISNRIGETE